MLVTTYIIDGVEYESTLREDLHISEESLNEEFIRHSERFAWYATAYELSLAKEKSLKDQLGMLYAQIDNQVRTMAASVPNIKMTEKKIENTVITDPAYVSLNDAYREAERMTGLLKAARDAMMSKKDCLISLGANKRAEFASDPSLRNTR